MLDESSTMKQQTVFLGTDTPCILITNIYIYIAHFLGAT